MTERFLIIDDSSTIQKVVQLAFAPFDVEIVAANSYIEAISESNQGALTLILADASLPGIKGAADYQNLQSKLDDVPFVVLIGSYDGINQSDFSEVGFEHFLNKPFAAVDLILTAWKAIGKSLEPADQAGAPPPAPPVPTTPPVSRAQPETEVKFSLELEDNEQSPASIDLSDEKEHSPEPSQEAPESVEPLSVTLDRDFMPPPPPPLAETDAVMQPSTSPYDDDAMQSSEQFSYAGEEGLGGDHDVAEREQVQGLLEPFLREEMAKVVRETVQDYCERQFARIAREVVTQELEKLNSEKSRLLIDN